MTLRPSRGFIAAMNVPTSSRWLVAGCLAIAAAVAVAHGGALGHGFVTFDDDVYVTANDHVKAGLTPAGAAWAFSLAPRKTYYHPMAWLSLMADATLYGIERPWGFHLTNLLLHAATAVLLFLALARGTRRPLPSLVASLLFATHPLTVEAVTWVTERKCVLSGALGLGAILAYVRHSERPSRPRMAWVAALQGASVLAKPTFVVLPAILLALDFWPLRRLPVDAEGVPSKDPGVWRALLWEKLPVFAVSAGSVLITLLRPGDVDALVPTASPGPSLRLANAIASFATYLSAALWPSSLSIFHPFPREVPASAVAVGAAALLLVSAVALLALRRAPAIAVGWVWFLVAILPALGLKQTGMWPGWAERFAYVPLMGLSVALVFGAADLLGRLPRLAAVAAAVAAALLAPLLLATRSQVEIWADSMTLYRHGLASEPRSPELLWNLGTLLLNQQRVPEAAPVVERLVEVAPGWSQAQGQLGSIRKMEGRLAESEVHLREAIRLDPYQLESLFNLAEILRLTGRLDEARPFYGRFAAIAPEQMAVARAQARRFAAP